LYPCGFARGERVCLPAQSALLAAFRSRHQFLGSQIWAPCDLFMVLVREGCGEEQASSALVNSFFKSSPLDLFFGPTLLVLFLMREIGFDSCLLPTMLDFSSWTLPVPHLAHHDAHCSFDFSPHCQI
jgi:hypothetical protein